MYMCVFVISHEVQYELSNLNTLGPGELVQSYIQTCAHQEWKNLELNHTHEPHMCIIILYRYYIIY